MQNKHSLISPSNFERRMLCPGSLNAEKDLPETTSKYAEEGKMLHERVVECMTFGNWSRGLNEDQKDAVFKCVTYFDELKFNKDVIKELHEKTFDLSFIYPGMKGTADSILITKDDKDNCDLHVIDYKFGKGVAVNAYQNYQLLLYLLAVCYDSDVMNILKDKEFNVHLHIVQPYLHNSVWNLINDELISYCDPKAYRDIAEKCYALDASRIPSKKACQFCKAKSTCPALAKIIPDIKVKIDQLQDAEIVNIYENRKLILLYLDSIEQYIKNKLEQGSFLDYELKPKLSNRKWNEHAIRHLEELLEDKAYETTKKLISITKAEKLLDREIINELTIKEEVGNEIIKMTDEATKIFDTFED